MEGELGYFDQATVKTTLTGVQEQALFTWLHTLQQPKSFIGVTRVQIERPTLNIKDYLWGSTLGLVGLVGQAMVVLFITFFLLASGDSFRRKLVRIAGPSFAQRRITVNYAPRQQGRKMMQGQSSHLPLKVNMSDSLPLM